MIVALPGRFSYLFCFCIVFHGLFARPLFVIVRHYYLIKALFGQLILCYFNACFAVFAL